jgi:hypothetical protein
MQQLHDIFGDYIRSLIQTLEAKNQYTHDHSRRVYDTRRRKP